MLILRIVSYVRSFLFVFPWQWSVPKYAHVSLGMNKGYGVTMKESAND